MRRDSGIFPRRLACERQVAHTRPPGPLPRRAPRPASGLLATPPQPAHWKGARTREKSLPSAGHAHRVLAVLIVWVYRAFLHTRGSPSRKKTLLKQKMVGRYTCALKQSRQSTASLHFGRTCPPTRASCSPITRKHTPHLDLHNVISATRLRQRCDYSMPLSFHASRLWVVYISEGGRTSFAIRKKKKGFQAGISAPDWV